VKILLLTEYFDPEPALIPSLKLAHFFESQGHQVEVLTGFPNYPGGKFYPGTKVRPWKREVIEGVRVNRVALYPSHDRSAIKRIASYVSFALSATVIGSLLIDRPDVVYLYYTPPTVALPAVIWKKLCKIPYVLQAQDLWPESVIESGMVAPGWARTLMETSILKWLAFVNRHCAALVTISEGFKRELVIRGADENKVSVILNWTDEVKFQPIPRDQQLAEQLGFSDKVNVVYGGNIGHYQGLGQAIEAASRLAFEFPSFQLVIIGSGQAQADLVHDVETRGLSNVRVLGYRPLEQMARINAISDALLISLADIPFFAMTIPSKTQVAMACGRPIIMAVTGDAAVLVDEAHAGLTCHAGDVDGLERLFCSFMKMTPEEREVYGSSGLEYYRTELCLARGGQHLLNLLVAAADERT
jgi:glycosyltransferase involved in cell wall biosynthesis